MFVLMRLHSGLVMPLCAQQISSKSGSERRGQLGSVGSGGNWLTLSLPQMKEQANIMYVQFCERDCYAVKLVKE